MRGIRTLVRQIRIGICDDNEFAHDLVEGYTKEYCQKNGIDIEVIHYYSGEDLLNSKDDLDGLLLDIAMPDMDGIEVGRQLKNRGVPYKVIMLTVRQDKIKEAFKINAFRFVSKPVEQKEFDEAISDLIERLDEQKEFSVYDNRNEYIIRQDEIFYIEARGSETRVFTKNYDFRSEKSLTQWEEDLDEKRFYRTHRSYIVHMKYIKERKETDIELKNGEIVKVSKERKDNFELAYMNYDTRYR